jgi:hypothetical protein
MLSFDVGHLCLTAGVSVAGTRWVRCWRVRCCHYHQRRPERDSSVTHDGDHFEGQALLDSWIRQLESDVRNCELQCYRGYKHTWSPMSETKEH